MPNDISRWIAVGAADKLSEKTAIQWAHEKVDNDDIVTAFIKEVPKDLIDQAGTLFIEMLKKNGIEFKIQLKAERSTKKDYYKIYASASHPLELEAMMKNIFTYPAISQADILNAVAYLNLKTPFTWNFKKIDNHFAIHVHTSIPSQNYVDGKIIFEKKLENCGIALKTDIISRQPGTFTSSEILATITNPLEFHALSEAYKKQYTLKQVSPIHLSGVRTSIAATTMLLLEGGCSREEATEKKGIPFIDFTEQGGIVMTIPNNEYAQRLKTILMEVKKFISIDCAKDSNILVIKDPTEVKRFIEKICNLSSVYTKDLYDVFRNDKQKPGRLSVYNQIEETLKLKEPQSSSILKK